LKQSSIAAAVAGLLHDLGKFALRAGVTPSQTWDAEAEAEYRYKHALLSGDVAAHLLGSHWPEAQRAICYHHRPDHPAAGRLARVVALADRLASGERIRSDEAEPQRLLSVFARLFEERSESGLPQSPRYLPLRPLRIDRETLFAQPQDAHAESRTEYESLWEAFRSAPLMIEYEDGQGSMRSSASARLARGGRSRSMACGGG